MVLPRKHHAHSAGERFVGKADQGIVDAADVREKDYFIWDENRPALASVFASRRNAATSIQYRAAGRTRRYTIGLHGVWTQRQPGRSEGPTGALRGDNPSEERQLDHKAITVKSCALYTADLNAGLILGKGGRPKSQPPS